MAKTRLITTNLLRMLDRVTTPVYLIEANQLITYANKACLEWCGIEAQDLTGAICRYTSQKLADPVENRIRGLAPPPDLLDSKQANAENRAFSAFVDLEDGSKQFRTAQVSKLFDSQQDLTALLVVCERTTRVRREKPQDAELIEQPDQLHELLAHLRDSARQKYELGSILGLDSTNLALQKKIEIATRSNADVLIHGPSGSGREHLARAIDNERRPNSNPPIPLHCELADQELIQRNIKELGLAKSREVRSADSSDCLLLLDVDRLSEVGQAELWGFVTLAGFSLQIISTSSQPLMKLAHQKNFHRGLAGYLSTISLELLPLTERARDLPILAQSILEDINANRTKQLAGFSPAAMQLIQQFDWPQNIDQLHRDIRAAANVAKGRKIVLEDLPENLRQASRALEIGRPIETQIRLNDYLQEIETELILRAMKHAKGNKSKAAKLLGVSRPKLLRRLQLLKFDPGDGDESPEQEFVDSSAFQEADDGD